ncbi:hypothetical protein FIBSPDRAFT_851949 [Athelia psychrophila]|uniref:Uncharacterized protein n=1 Tax=Athelia psychrophila TaxID=1759441 RepID=A0A166S7J4_9AGAM|nr:hypothetical protein FIBSPDRAFT_851949 [Fibularhizoctonia sp. CBS 109695]
MSQPPSPSRAPSAASHHSDYKPEPDHAHDKETNHQPRRGRSLSLSSDEPRRGSRSRGRAAHHPSRTSKTVREPWKSARGKLGECGSRSQRKGQGAAGGREEGEEQGQEGNQSAVGYGPGHRG